MARKDYYDVMGLSRNASQPAIKNAYRRLARQYHPDVSSAADATERFKELGEAYEALKDVNKRASYDQLLNQQQSVTISHRSAMLGFAPILVLVAALGAGHLYSHRDVHASEATPTPTAVETEVEALSESNHPPAEPGAFNL